MKLLIICCDAGETRALLPVIPKLQAKKVDFNILALGVAISELQKETCLKDRLIICQEKVDTAKERLKPLDDVAGIIKNLHPTVVLSGPASKAQGQLLEALPAKKKIVYLDSFDYTLANLAVGEVITQAHKVICTSTFVKEQISGHLVKKLKDRDIKVLGRPSLASWEQNVGRVDKTKALAKVDFSASKPVVTIIGGYGQPYDDGVDSAFISAQAALVAEDYQVHVQSHPNLRKPQTLTTEEAVSIADYIICYNSTVGFEALFVGKRVIYLSPKNVPLCHNLALQKNLAHRVSTNEELLGILKNYPEATQDVYQTLGIARESTQLITEYLLKKLGLNDTGSTSMRLQGSVH